MQLVKRLMLLLPALLLAACSTLETAPAPALEKEVRWALLPAVNHTETTQAGGRLDAITASLLQARGIKDLQRYAGSGNESVLASADRATQDAALAWARSQNAKYAVYGSVQEWRYKTGLDGEPAAGLTLTIVDVASGRVLWTGSGARTGWSREAVASVAQKLAGSLLDKALSSTPN
jgi:PBP1b-binding outer membrane lipoprotein LpoB